MELATKLWWMNGEPQGQVSEGGEDRVEVRRGVIPDEEQPRIYSEEGLPRAWRCMGKVCRRSLSISPHWELQGFYSRVPRDMRPIAMTLQ